MCVYQLTLNIFIYRQQRNCLKITFMLIKYNFFVTFIIYTLQQCPVDNK
jgi:hypothetical protein